MVDHCPACAHVAAAPLLDDRQPLATLAWPRSEAAARTYEGPQGATILGPEHHRVSRLAAARWTELEAMALERLLAAGGAPTHPPPLLRPLPGEGQL